MTIARLFARLLINLEHFCRRTNVWVTSKTSWTGRWPAFSRSPEHGSSVGMSAKDSHISSAIRDELHWLPVQCRSKFKICVLVRNCIIGSSPPYLQELCLPVASVSGRRHLRSADRNDLLVPQFRTVNYGQRGFSTLGPRLWNSLPRDIRLSIDSLELFKNKLKTYFFQLQQWHQRLCGSSSWVALY